MTPITYNASFVDCPNEAFYHLWNELAWIRHDKVPRREYYSNDFEVPYTYGTPPYDRTYQPQPWHPVMRMLQKKAEEAAECKFDMCFLNGYEDQSDQLGWHSDNSPEMDDERPIAIISLGVEREIWFRPTPRLEDPTGVQLSEIDKLKLQHGSLCLMHAGMQDTHQHRIPKASFNCSARISLTFRGYT